MNGNDSGPSGRFCWYEHMSTDPEAAKRFYTRLLPWTTRQGDRSPVRDYTMFRAGDRDIAGILALDPARKGPAHWMAYVTVDDVDAAAARVPAVGGAVTVPAADIPGIGRFAVIADPAGGQLSLFKGAGEIAEPAGPMGMGAGRFCWNELLTHDVEGCKRFYSEVVGWTTAEYAMGDMGVYHLFKRGETDAAGMMQMPAEARSAPSHWLAYVLVDDVDATTGRVAGLGGAVTVPPRDIPGIGRFSVCADSLGGAFALFKGQG